MGFSIKLVFGILLTLMLIFPSGNLAFSQQMESTSKEKPIERNSINFIPEFDHSTINLFSKTVTIPSKSTFESGERLSTSIPEELVLQGVEFKLYSHGDKTKNDISNESSFDIKFIDSDGNKLVDTIEWKGTPGLGKKYLIEADLSNTIELNADSTLQKMGYPSILSVYTISLIFILKIVCVPRHKNTKSDLAFVKNKPFDLLCYNINLKI